MSTLHKSKKKNKYPKWYVVLRNSGQWIIAQSFFGLLAFMRLFPPDASINMIEKLGIYFGMRYKRTEVARQNIKQALPEKTDEEVEEILREMWGSLSRTAAEYAYLDQIFDFDDQNPTEGRFEIAGIDNFTELKALEGPAVCFTAHIANWELLPIGSAAYGVNITALFRPPDNPYIAKR
ncbi:MAG: lipid A biosynthesis lauroyl acyltransferase, partial [Rhizobiaceae bacterium]